MKKCKSAVILSVLAAICFFITYFLNKGTRNLILGILWIVIAIANYIKTDKEQK